MQSSGGGSSSSNRRWGGQGCDLVCAADPPAVPPTPCLPVAPLLSVRVAYLFSLTPSPLRAPSWSATRARACDEPSGGRILSRISKKVDEAHVKTGPGGEHT